MNIYPQRINYVGKTLRHTTEHTTCRENMGEVGENHTACAGMQPTTALVALFKGSQGELPVCDHGALSRLAIVP